MMKAQNAASSNGRCVRREIACRQVRLFGTITQFDRRPRDTNLLQDLKLQVDVYRLANLESGPCSSRRVADRKARTMDFSVSQLCKCAQGVESGGGRPIGPLGVPYFDRACASKSAGEKIPEVGSSDARRKDPREQLHDSPGTPSSVLLPQKVVHAGEF